MPIEQLTQAYIVGTHEGSILDYSCEDCARDFIKDTGAVWNNPTLADWTLEHESVHASAIYSWQGAESDYPVSCGGCGQYLSNVDLTSEGVAELLDPDNGYPEWLKRAHAV
jgi:hypothetical protein